MSLERRESFVVFYVIAFVVVAIAAGAVYVFWSGKQKRLDEETKVRAALVDQGPLVATALTARGPDYRKVALLGEARPYKTATLYAKVSGYLARIAVNSSQRSIPRSSMLNIVALPPRWRIAASWRSALEIWPRKASSRSRHSTTRIPTCARRKTSLRKSAPCRTTASWSLPSPGS
jgi:hypothetical protein